MKLNADSQGMEVNKKELAQIFGISERSFSEYQKDPSFPFIENGARGEGNCYDTAQIFRYLIMRSEEKQKSKRTALADAKTEQATADAALKRLQVNEKLGELIHKEDAFSLLTDWARFANQQIKEGFDRMILDIQSEQGVEISKEMREKYVTTTSERVRDYALKLAGCSSDSKRDISDPQETVD